MRSEPLESRSALSQVSLFAERWITPGRIMMQCRSLIVRGRTRCRAEFTPSLGFLAAIVFAARSLFWPLFRSMWRQALRTLV